MSEIKKFGKLRLSGKGTNNGSGFDILYDFGESHDFVEFTSKAEFYFIQPWMQFPAKKYTDECMRVSIELVHRFNQFEINEKSLLQLQENDMKHWDKRRELEDIIWSLKKDIMDLKKLT